MQPTSNTLDHHSIGHLPTVPPFDFGTGTVQSELTKCPVSEIWSKRSRQISPLGSR